MNLDSLSAVLIAIAFLVPGFILSAILAMTFRRRPKSASEMTLQYLTFSCLNHGFWCWLVVLMIEGDWMNRFPLWSAGVVFLVLFLSPIAMGLAARFLATQAPVQRWLSALGFNVQRFIPTSWDWRFQRIPPSWIIVRLKDGSTVYVYFGTQSFAGDDPEERDLFIECVFQHSLEAGWQPVADSGGILIKADQIATIEFKQISEVSNGA